MLCVIWYHLCNLKNVKNTHGGVLASVAGFNNETLLKVTLLHGCFLRLLNCTDGTKSRNASHIVCELCKCELVNYNYCVKYTRIRVFSGPYIPL